MTDFFFYFYYCTVQFSNLKVCTFFVLSAKKIYIFLKKSRQEVTLICKLYNSSKSKRESRKSNSHSSGSVLIGDYRFGSAHFMGVGINYQKLIQFLHATLHLMDEIKHVCSSLTEAVWSMATETYSQSRACSGSVVLHWHTNLETQVRIPDSALFIWEEFEVFSAAC